MLEHILQNGTLTITAPHRIETANVAQIEADALALATEHEGTPLAIDASGLEYISSAGLRVLLKLAKMQKSAKLPIQNVSPDVYEIFETTGFTTILDVQKRLRQVSIEGAAFIGEGANGKVYRIGDDQIIKVYRPTIPLETVREEREASKRAFLLGVPSAIAFDTVRCGDGYGNVFELIDADSVAGRIQKQPEKLAYYAEATGKLLRQLHNIELPAGTLQAAESYLHRNIDALGEYFTEAEREKLHKVFTDLPAKSRFIHNDFHLKNIMEANGELVLIDLGDAGAGNPLIDLIHCYMICKIVGSGLAERVTHFIGVTPEQIAEYWPLFLKAYLGTDDDAAVEAQNARLAPYADIMHRITAMCHPLSTPESRTKYAEHVRGLLKTKF